MAALQQDIRLFKRVKRQVLVSGVSSVKLERSLLFGTSRYLFPSHKADMPYLT